MARGSSALKLWAISYLTTAVAAMTGGTYHGLFGILGDVGATILWKVTVYAIGLTSLTMLAASVTTVVAPGRRIFWIVPIVAKFVVFAWWMSHHDAFVYVIADLALAILGIVVLHAWHSLRTGDKAHVGVIVAMLIAVAGAVLQQWKLSLHAHFDHNDLYHMVQIISLIVLSRALLAMRA